MIIIPKIYYARASDKLAIWEIEQSLIWEFQNPLKLIHGQIRTNKLVLKVNVLSDFFNIQNEFYEQKLLNIA